MPDMICPLIDLPSLKETLQQLETRNITIRRPNPWELTAVLDFIGRHFSAGWVDETRVAFSHQPVTAYIALDGDKIIGFSAYECTRKNYFGPTGVDETYRGLGIGKVLFIAALRGLRDLGYTYAIIGGAGPVDFYKRTAGAEVIAFNGGRGIYDLKKAPELYQE